MENKQLVKYKNNFILNIKSFFKNLLKKSEQDNKNMQEKRNNDSIQGVNKTEEQSFLNDIKVDNSIINKKSEMRKFLEDIDGNEELLNKLSIDRLIELEKYYANVIEENKKKIMQASG